MLAQLARKGELAVGELGEPYAMSGPAISKHLRVLEGAGLISREKQGRVRMCRLKPRRLEDASVWLTSTRSYWENQLDALARYLNNPNSDR
ncbi:MAG: metalloregulator ArsR/SmtB family transcription factor [Thermoanaerobaculia bacterium]